MSYIEESADPMRSSRQYPHARYHADALWAGTATGIAQATRHFRNRKSGMSTRRIADKNPIRSLNEIKKFHFDGIRERRRSYAECVAENNNFGFGYSSDMRPDIR
ncbi:hypothetical protein [Burkholderia sp. MSMB1459WGS]|uniref:hypothetical protein n=1 Tax=Burkholderia sp. MSMB1459WGS TaxID=1637970 RepID=UPI0012E35CA2|nr:hypothetical protein [Burkholderia sp. MSMB1459WGS]